MKNRGLLVTTVVFFFVVNTTYFWETELGPYYMLALLLLVIVFVVLSILTIRQLYLVIKEKCNNGDRVKVLVFLVAVLVSTSLKPFGIINFETLTQADLLVAKAEGSIGCTSTIRLKQNNIFHARNICFGVTQVSGEYKVSNDTVYFEKIELGIYKDNFGQFAVIEPSPYKNDTNRIVLMLYENVNDTSGVCFWISENKLKDKKPNR